MHREEKVYVPAMIFGQLLTSSNYDDEERKVTGGRNGYGAKLCNIFSTEFTIETSCKESGRMFRQVSNFKGSMILICYAVPHNKQLYFIIMCVCVFIVDMEGKYEQGRERSC